MLSLKSTSPSPPLCYATATTVLSTVFVYGGYTGEEYSDSLWVLRATEDDVSWSQPQLSMRPPPRYKHSAALAGLHLLIFGGSNVLGPLNDLWQLDTVSLKWTTLGPFMASSSSSSSHDAALWPSARCSHSCTVIDKSDMWMYGGQTSDQLTSDELWVYHSITGKWEQPVTTGPQPPPLVHHSAIAKDKKLILLGGHGGDRSFRWDSIHILDTVTLQWVTINIHADMLPRHSSMSFCRFGDVYVGLPETAPSRFSDPSNASTLVLFNPELLTWTRISEEGADALSSSTPRNPLLPLSPASSSAVSSAFSSRSYPASEGHSVALIMMPTRLLVIGGRDPDDGHVLSDLHILFGLSLLGTGKAAFQLQSAARAILHDRGFLKKKQADAEAGGEGKSLYSRRQVNEEQQQLLSISPAPPSEPGSGTSGGRTMRIRLFSPKMRKNSSLMRLFSPKPPPPRSKAAPALARAAGVDRVSQESVPEELILGEDCNEVDSENDENSSSEEEEEEEEEDISESVVVEIMVPESKIPRLVLPMHNQSPAPPTASRPASSSQPSARKRMASRSATHSPEPLHYFDASRSSASSSIVSEEEGLNMRLSDASSIAESIFSSETPKQSTARRWQHLAPEEEISAEMSSKESLASAIASQIISQSISSSIASSIQSTPRQQHRSSYVPNSHLYRGSNSSISSMASSFMPEESATPRASFASSISDAISLTDENRDSISSSISSMRSSRATARASSDSIRSSISSVRESMDNGSLSNRTSSGSGSSSSGSGSARSSSVGAVSSSSARRASVGTTPTRAIEAHSQQHVHRFEPALNSIDIRKGVSTAAHAAKDRMASEYWESNFSWKIYQDESASKKLTAPSSSSTPASITPRSKPLVSSLPKQVQTPVRSHPPSSVRASPRPPIQASPATSRVGHRTPTPPISSPPPSLLEQHQHQDGVLSQRSGFAKTLPAQKSRPTSPIHMASVLEAGPSSTSLSSRRPTTPLKSARRAHSATRPSPSQGFMERL